MHVFLYGQMDIGKSTVIQSVVTNLIEDLNIKLGGFVTYPGIGIDRDIYISSTTEIRKYEITNRVAKRNNHNATGIPEIFNTFGVSILKKSNYANLLCMDELGFLEKDATLFQNVVLKYIDEDIPILGVVKEAPIPWLNSIKFHPKVELVNITIENRNTIVPIIVEKLKSTLIKRK